MGFLQKIKGFRIKGGGFGRFAVISTVIVALFVMVLKHDNIFRWIGAGLDIREQKRQIEWYQKEIERLDMELESLRTNRDSLEKFARERFYFAAPGEDVYLIER